MNKKVSVIVPIYNKEKYLDKTINSIINQTYKNLEIILIDDASKDNSINIIKKYALLDSRIIPIYSNINNGVSKSRNIGLDICSGDYIIFIDADDYILDNMIKDLVKYSIKYNSDYVDSYEVVIYNNMYFTEGKIPKNILVMGNINNNINIINKYTYIKGKLFKRELIDNIRFDNNLRCYEDLLFEHNLKLRVKNYIFLNKTYYYYYQDNNSLINSLGEKHICYLDAASKIIKLYRNKDINIKYKIESILFTNAFFIGISKIIKNNNDIDYNTNLLYNYLIKFKDIFITYESNKYINYFLKKYYNKLVNNKKKIYKLVKRSKNINFTNIYFKYLYFKYKIEAK